MWPKKIIRAAESSQEVRAALHVALLENIPISIVEPGHQGVMRRMSFNGVLPIGSVEYVREVMKVAGVMAPAPLTYPVELDAFLGRPVALMQLDRVRGDVFIKPVETKLFNGFVWRQGVRDKDLSLHDREQLTLLRALPPETPVWTSLPVRFVSEWRYYVLDDALVGEARYDQDGVDSAPAPDARKVIEAIEVMAKVEGRPAGYALDFGVMESGETALVEFNDGWALGYYQGGISTRSYLQLLWSRWQQIVENKSA